MPTENKTQEIPNKTFVSTAAKPGSTKPQQVDS